MNFFTLLSQRFFLDEGDAGGDSGEAGKSDANDNIDGGSNDEKARQDNRAAFESKVRRDKRKEVEELFAEIDSQKTLIEDLTSKLNSLADTTQKNKGGRPKNEDNQNTELLESLGKRIEGLSTDMASRLDTLERNMEADRDANYRRDLLASAGANREFMQLVDQGVINIPNEYLQDFDKLNGLMSKLGGLTATPKGNGDATSTISTTQGDKTVPHRDGDADTGAIHTDKSNQTGVKETLQKMNDDLDKIMDKDDGTPIGKDELTKAFDIAEKLDDMSTSR